MPSAPQTAQRQALANTTATALDLLRCECRIGFDVLPKYLRRIIAYLVKFVTHTSVRLEQGIELMVRRQLQLCQQFGFTGKRPGQVSRYILSGTSMPSTESACASFCRTTSTAISSTVFRLASDSFRMWKRLS